MSEVILVFVLFVPRLPSGKHAPLFKGNAVALRLHAWPAAVGPRGPTGRNVPATLVLGSTGASQQISRVRTYST